MSRLILHVGTHKTGTTSIQKFLRTNRERLSQQGIYYPDATKFLGTNVESHHGVAAAIAEPGPFSEPLKRFREHLAKELRRADVILSSEAFYRHVMPPTPRSPEFDPNQYWKQRDQYISKLAEFFKDFTPIVSVYFRHPVSFAESLYANQTVTKPTPIKFTDFLKSRFYMFSYAQQLDCLSRHFRDVSVRSFEASSRAGLLPGFFADHGLAVDARDEPRLRTALRNPAVLWVQRLKGEQALSDAERWRRWRFALIPEHQPLFDEPRPSMFWSDMTQRAAFFAKYGHSIGPIVFEPPDPSPRETTAWDDAAHERANASYEAWIAHNLDEVRMRERARLFPYEEAPAGRAGWAHELLSGQVRRLRRRIARLVG